MALSFNIKGCIFIAKTEKRPRFFIGNGKHAFAQECFHLQGIFSYINKRDTSTPVCKYKHMLKRGAPPNKFGVLYLVLYIEFHSFNCSIDVLELSHFGSWYYFSFCTDDMGQFKVSCL